MRPPASFESARPPAARTACTSRRSVAAAACEDRPTHCHLIWAEYDSGKPLGSLLGATRYGKAVDMWSFGCTMAELMTFKVLFPGKNYIQQMKFIIIMVFQYRFKSANSP